MNSLLGMFAGGSGQKMCLYCKQKPAFQNYDYCGKTCAEWAKKNPPPPAAPSWSQGPPPVGPAAGPGWGYNNYGPPAAPPQQGPWPPYGQYPQGQSQAPSQGMCQNCHVKPVFPGHQYCSKTCGTSAKQGAGPPPMPPQPQGPPPNFNGYPPHPQQGPWPPGSQQGWGPNPQQGAPWQGPPPPQGGQPWGPPQQNWNQGGPPRRMGRRSGGYGDDDDDWPDDEEEDEYWDDEPPRSKRTSLAKKGTKMCMNCFKHPSVGKAEFCSKKCKMEASAKLNKGSGVARRGTAARRRAGEYDDD